MSILSLLGPLYTAGEAIASIINPTHNRPLTTILGIGGAQPATAISTISPPRPTVWATPAPYNPGTSFIPASYTAGPMVGPTVRALAPVARTAARWAARMLRQYGPVIGYAIVNEAQRNRERGMAVYDSHRAAEYTHAGTVSSTRRRMNPTNIRALRRAVRRVRSFKRITSKVKGLGIGGRRGYHTHYPRRRRRGDVSPFYTEDLADVYDEAEDLGYEPSYFPDGGDDLE